MEHDTTSKFARLKLLSFAIQAAVKNKDWQETQVLLAERGNLISDFSQDPSIDQAELVKLIQLNSKIVEDGTQLLDENRHKQSQHKRAAKNNQKFLPKRVGAQLDRKG